MTRGNRAGSMFATVLATSLAVVAFLIAGGLGAGDVGINETVAGIQGGLAIAAVVIAIFNMPIALGYLVFGEFRALTRGLNWAIFGALAAWVLVVVVGAVL